MPVKLLRTAAEAKRNRKYHTDTTLTAQLQYSIKIQMKQAALTFLSGNPHSDFTDLILFFLSDPQSCWSVMPSFLRGGSRAAGSWSLTVCFSFVLLGLKLHSRVGWITVLRDDSRLYYRLINLAEKRLVVSARLSNTSKCTIKSCGTENEKIAISFKASVFLCRTSRMNTKTLFLLFFFLSHGQRTWNNKRLIADAHCAYFLIDWTRWTIKS